VDDPTGFSAGFDSSFLNLSFNKGSSAYWSRTTGFDKPSIS